MRHSEISQAPCERRDCRHRAERFVRRKIVKHFAPEIAVYRALRKLLDLLNRASDSAQRKNHYCGRDDERDENQHSLNEIRGADGAVAAHDCVRKNYHESNQKSDVPIQSENRAEQFRASHESRCRVNREKYDDEKTETIERM